MKHRLKEVLLEKGMTQKELAERSGFTEVGISKMVNSGTATKSSLDRIANALNVDLVKLEDHKTERKALYEGELHIGNKILPCAVLDDGSRVITATSIFDVFERPRKGKSSESYRADLMPSFVNANNLQPFVDEQFMQWTELVGYLSINGVHKQSYNARIIRGLCKIYLDAANAGVLTKNQERFAVIAQSILYALADVGIIALVDEATGYDKEKSRAKNELQKYLDTFLRDEAAKWVKTFNDQFFEDIYKMRHWTWTQTSKRPGVVGTWIKDIVYDRLGPILTEIEKLNPKNDNGNRGHKHFQFLSDDIGLPRLKQHLEAIHAIAVISNYDWSTFTYNLDKAYPRKNIELFLDFGDEEDD